MGSYKMKEINTVKNIFSRFLGGIVLVLGVLNAMAQPGPGAMILGPSALCAGGVTTYTSDAPGGLWRTDNVFVARINDTTGVLQAAGAGTATITYLSPTGLVTKEISVNATRHPVAQVIGSTNVALGLQFYGVATQKNTVYVCDYFNGVVIAYGPGGTRTTFAGSLVDYSLPYSGDNLPATAVLLKSPSGIACDRYGNVYFSDNQTHTVKKVDTNGIMTNVAGMVPTPPDFITTFTYTFHQGFSGDNGPATAALLNGPASVAVDGLGNVYVADNGNARIRKIGTDGIMQTVVGLGVNGFTGDGGPATAAKINNPGGLAVDGENNLLLTDTYNGRIRKVTADGNINTIYEIGLTLPTGLALDKWGNIYVADGFNEKVYQINAQGVMSQIAGGGAISDTTADGLPATMAQLANAYSLAIDGNGNMFMGSAPYLWEFSADLFVPRINGNAAVCVGGERMLTDSVSGGIWTSSNNGIATVDPMSGIVTGVNVGVDTIVYTFSNGCDSFSVAMALTVDPVPHAFSLPAGLCLGSSLTLSEDVPGGIWHSVMGRTTIDTDQTLLAVQKGMDTIAYRMPGGCSVSTPISVDSTAGDLVCDSIQCLNNTVSFSGFDADGSWAAAGGALTTSAGAVGTFTLTASGPVILVYTNSCGSVLKSISVADPSYNIQSAICVGNTVSPDTIPGYGGLTIASFGGIWTTSNGAATVDAWGNVTAASAGTDTLTYYFSPACFRSEVLALSASAPGPITGSAVYCVGTSLSLNETGPGKWVSDNVSTVLVQSGVSSSVSDILLQVGSANISFFNGCGTVSKTINVYAVPDAGAITGNNTICAGINDTLSGTAFSGAWGASNGNAVLLSPGVFLAANAGSDTISYTATTGCGTAVATFVLSINPQPVAGELPASINICMGSTTTLTPTLSGGAWSAASTNIVVSDEGLVTAVSAGTDSVLYSVTNVCGTGVAVTAVTVTPIPFAGILFGADTLCPGAHASELSSAPGGTWSGGNFAAFLSPAGVITGITGGVDTITYTVSNSCGTDFINKTVTVVAFPTVSAITGSDSLCSGTSITLSETAEGGSWSSAFSAIATVAGGVVTGVAPGLDSIRYISSNYCGTASASKFVYVKAQPNAGTINGIDSVCAGNHVMLSNVAPGGSWSISNGRAVMFGSYVIGVSAGLDTVSYTVINSCGTAVSHFEVSIMAVPDAGMISGSAAVCVGNAVSLSEIFSGGIWTTTDNTIASVNTHGLVTGHLAGLDTIVYTRTNICGSTHDKFVMMVDDVITPVVSGLSFVCVGGTADTLVGFPAGGVFLSANATAAFDTVGLPGILRAQGPGMDTVTYLVTNGCGVFNTQIPVMVFSAWQCDSVLGAPSPLPVSQAPGIYPNPTSGSFTVVVAPLSAVGVSIYDVTGKVLAETHGETSGAGEFSVNPGSLSPGTYLVQIVQGTLISRTKLVVMR